MLSGHRLVKCTATWFSGTIEVVITDVPGTPRSINEAIRARLYKCSSQSDPCVELSMSDLSPWIKHVNEEALEDQFRAFWWEGFHWFEKTPRWARYRRSSRFRELKDAQDYVGAMEVLFKEQGTMLPFFSEGTRSYIIGDETFYVPYSKLEMTWTFFDPTVEDFVGKMVEMMNARISPLPLA